MSFCERCKKLIAFIDGEYSKAEELQGQGREGRPYYKSRTDHRIDLQVSQDCTLCALIFDTISDDKLSELLEHRDPHLNVEAQWHFSIPRRNFSLLFNGLPRSHALSTLEVYHGDTIYYLSHGRHFDFTPDGQLAISHDTPENSTDSGATWSLALQWLTACNSTHKTCKTGASLPLPTRLLSISSSNSVTEVKLIESSKLATNVDYCTLSHCWGKTQITTLQRSNYDTFLKGITLSSLSKTFRDAIHAAVSLGFQYLWIDSLCIVQNDKLDWANEALMMSSVYSGSALNLAATSAADGRAGLFFNRNKGSARVCITEKLRRRILVNNEIWQKYVENGPLAERGWVTQERFLAARTIHFTSSQVFWECREMRASESFPNGQKGDNKELFNTIPLKTSLLTSNGWSRVVEQYCSTVLSKEEDKLIAMSGIAKHFQSQLKDQYLAGLWLKNIEIQLLWQVGVLSAYDLTASRPSKYRAPSWSWASLDGEVEIPKSNVHSTESILIRVVEAKIQPVIPSQSFGQIQSASLTIECGPLKKGFGPFRKDSWISTFRLSFIHTEAGPRHFGNRKDIGKLVATDVVWLMLVANKETPPSPMGLMLQPTGGAGEYERLGIFFLGWDAYETTTATHATVDQFLSAPAPSAVDNSNAYCHIERPSDRREEWKYFITLI